MKMTPPQNRKASLAEEGIWNQRHQKDKSSENDAQQANGADNLVVFLHLFFGQIFNRRPQSRKEFINSRLVVRRRWIHKTAR